MKEMRIVLLLLLTTLLSSCIGQSDKETEKGSIKLKSETLTSGDLNSLATLKVPYEKEPQTPSKESLDSLDLIPFETLVIENKSTEGSNHIKYYRKDSQLFNGWAIQIFNENEHRFRYTHYANDLADWQIGYFDNGELGHDFHMKDGMNCGSARMWYKGGCPYIQTYFLEGGIGDGIAYAWHENCILSRDVLFKNGSILYEVKFDQEGKVVEKFGEIPEKYN